MSIIQSVINLKEKHKETWRDRDEAYWLDQFLEEVAELILSIHGKHEHSPDVELLQIAAISMNWLEMRNGQSFQQSVQRTAAPGDVSPNDVDVDFRVESDPNI